MSVYVLSSGCRVGFDPVGPVLWLEMETAPSASSPILDSAGGHVVTCSDSDCPAFSPKAGKHGNGYNFTGQQLRVAYTDDLDLGQSFTVGAWAVLDAYPSANHFACSFCKSVGTADADSYCMCVNPEMRDYFFSGDPDVGNGQDQAVGTLFTINQWHHVAMTWDRQTKTKIGYVDGCSVVRSSFQIEFDNSDLVVGADSKSGDPAYPWTGMIDDVVAYDRVLSPSEVARLAEMTTSCP